MIPMTHPSARSANGTLKSAFPLVVVLGISLLLAACGSRGGAAPAPTNSLPGTSSSAATIAATSTGAQVTINAIEKDGVISLDRSIIPAGQVTFKITNQGTLQHNLGLVRGNGASKADGITNPSALLQTSETINGGQTTSLTLVLAPDTYQVVCTVPGHIQLGMILPLTVQ